MCPFQQRPRESWDSVLESGDVDHSYTVAAEGQSFSQGGRRMHLLALLMTSLTSAISAVAAIVAAISANTSASTARHTLRLQLFERRFNIYKVAQDFANEVVTFDPKDQQKTTKMQDLLENLVHATVEARFLFAGDQRVYEQLKQLHKDGFGAIAFKRDIGPALSHSPEALLSQYEVFAGQLSNINKLLDPIAQVMSRYMEFRKL